MTKNEHDFIIDGQTCHFHDESINGIFGGHFHTYDNFCISSQHSSRKIHVFVPNDYLTNTEQKRYPVIYMNDGHKSFWNGGLSNKSWRVGETLSKIYETDQSKQVIVVAIHPVDRNREYTHSHWMWKYTYGGVDDYNNYIVNHVKPFIDRNYRTSSAAKHTVIVGSSHGGLAAFHMALSYPTIFGIAICMSTSFWAGLDWLIGSSLTNVCCSLEKSTLIQKYDHVLRSDNAPLLYIDWGLSKDWHLHNIIIERLAASRSSEMVKLLTKKYGYKHISVESNEHINNTEKLVLTHIDPHGEHDEIWWEKRFFTIVNILFDQIWKLK
ncbi:unnamed protein product [Rotaria sordida]|uniref:Esterase n=1 Tax=Rotaria sordida TaxID=392033 RepID=A0A815KWP4_9BILA|nr:unnamed protein product [Rotaria sordida]CAF3824533.1 unnamed protein product [Rotaria sordida]